MTDVREALERCLDALQRCRPQIMGALPCQDADRAIASARAALTQGGGDVEGVLSPMERTSALMDAIDRAFGAGWDVRSRHGNISPTLAREKWDCAEVLDDIQATLSEPGRGEDALTQEGVDTEAVIRDVFEWGWKGGPHINDDLEEAWADYKAGCEYRQAQAALAPAPVEGWRGEDRVSQLEIALRRCAETFRRYERLHLDKGTDDGHRKSIANADLANMCEKALGIPPIDVEPLPTKGARDG